MSDEKQVTVVSGDDIFIVVDGDEAAARRWHALQDGCRWPEDECLYTFDERSLVPAPPDTVTFEVTLSVADANYASVVWGGELPGLRRTIGHAARVALEKHFAALDAREEK